VGLWNVIKFALVVAVDMTKEGVRPPQMGALRYVGERGRRPASLAHADSGH
jgi:hypothetical protein